MRAHEFIKESVDADQVLDYVKRTHAPEEFDIEYSITDHPRWELKNIPLSQLKLDPDGEERDPYNRVNWVDYDTVSELIPRIGTVLKSKPIVVDSQGWIIDGNHRATAAAEAGLTSVPAYVPADLDEAITPKHQHTEIVRHTVGDWIIYLDNHSVIRAMTRGIGPRMMTDILTEVGQIPDLKDKVPVGGAFWIQDIKTNSSFYFKRLDIPSEPFAVRCETGVKDVPRAGQSTPVFRVNAYTGPENPRDEQAMKRAKLVNRFVGTNTMATTLARDIQKSTHQDVIRNPETQDSKRYDRAFKQARREDKELDENFADGKVKGKSRPGRVKRAGASCDGSVSDLRAKAKKYGGEKGKMYHWCANMKSGKSKTNESKVDPTHFSTEKLDDLLRRCVKMVQEKGMHRSDQFGRVAACIVDTRNRKMYGITTKGPDGKWIHAEQMAIKKYQKEFGKIQPGAIIVTTLSPCNRDMHDRHGPSCQDLLQKVGIEKVYTGYMDPTQHSDHPFEENITKNDDLWEVCKALSDSFVHQH